MFKEPVSEIARDRRHVLHSLHNAELQNHAHVWTSGRGAVLVDSTGQEFLDGLAGLWNVLIGHGRSELADAAAKQMNTLAYASSYAGSTTRPAIELAERLAQLCYPTINRFFFTSGGAESNESAFKTARYFWKLNNQPDKTKIIGRVWGYHGTTLGAMSATGISSYWPMFAPCIPGFLHIEGPYPYRFVGTKNGPHDSRTPGQQAADLLEEAILREGADTVAAFLGEPVQGAGGVIVPPDDYWPRIREICNRHQVLLVSDDVITGFGRTGTMFGLMQYGIEPDIVTLAKGITSGYFPLGAMGVTEQIAGAIDSAVGAKTWMHAFTYSGHPVGCAVALANLDLLERDGLYEKARAVGAQLQTQLRTLASHKNVGDVRGLGTIGGVELVADKITKAEFPTTERVGHRVHLAAQRRGFFTRLRGDVFNFAPCYVTTDAQIDRMVNILGEAIEEVLGR